jgi:flagellar protein FlaJ
MERLPRWQIALRRLEMPAQRYLIFYVGGATVVGTLVGLIIVFAIPGLFVGPSAVVLLLVLPLAATAAAVYYPFLEMKRSAILIEREMHMFITRMGILSLGEVGATSMFDILRQMGDYGELAVEVKRINTLVDKWHTSLPEAARIVAHQSASLLWSDFLDRMAFSIEAGQPIDGFMRAEQETISEQYNTLYDTRLEAVDTLKEIYVSLVSAGLFALVIAGIHLVLFMTGLPDDEPIVVMSRMRWLLLASFFFVIIQIGSLFAFRATLPDDPIFARDDMETPYRKLFLQSMLMSSIITVFLLIGTVILTITYWDVLGQGWDKYGLVLVAVPFTPMLIPAYIERREEKHIGRRDYSYPGFIRALGGTAQARSAEPSATIRALRGIDFGQLDHSIERLERRLSTRIDSERAWDYFAAETNSSLISRFNRIYIEGSQSSGRPAETAEMVSRSTTSILSLRNRRGLSAGTMVGTAIGLLIATVASLNVTNVVIMELGESIGGIAGSIGDLGKISETTTGGFGLPALDDNQVILQNIFLFKMVVSILIIIKVMTLSAISTRMRGGGYASSIGLMVQMTWIAGITSMGTVMLLQSSLSMF